MGALTLVPGLRVALELCRRLVTHGQQDGRERSASDCTHALESALHQAEREPEETE